MSGFIFAPGLAQGLRYRPRSALGKHVLVLRVPGDQGPLAPAADHELEAHEPRRGRDKRDRAVRVLARRHLAPPLAEVEDRLPPVTAHHDVPQRLVVVSPGKLTGLD